MAADIKVNTLLSDKQKAKLNQFDLFDRVINLKLYVVSKEESEKETPKVYKEYVIRSDFEMFFPTQDITKVMLKGNTANDKFIIRKCRYKPSIKVDYKQVGGGTLLAINFYLANFFMMGSDGKQVMQFNLKDYKIERVDCMMGYYPQFASLLAGQPPSKAIDKDFFFDFSPEKAINGITLLENCQVQYVVTDKLPPDYSLKITCIVGNKTNKPVNYNYEGKETYSEAEETKHVMNLSEESEKSLAERIFYKYVTKRFVNKSVLPKDTELHYEDDGSLTDEDADKYGVKCITSPELDKWKLSPIKSSTKEDVDRKLYIDNAPNSVGNMIERLREIYSVNFSYTMLNNGAYIICKQGEDSDYEQLCKDMEPKLEEYFKSQPASYYWENKIPAVYNITADVIAQIVCPFYYMVNPMQVVEFKNRYATGTMVSYITDYNAQVMKFLVISAEVKFATVEDLNEMQLDCVSKVSG